MMTKATQKLQSGAKKIVRPVCGFAVDHAALSSAVLIAGLGLWQLISPNYISPLTGLPDGFVGNTVAVVWLAIGALLTISIATQSRKLTAHAASLMFFAGLASFIVAMIERPDIIHFLVHGAIAFVGFTTIEVACLTHKEGLKRVVTRAKTTLPQIKITTSNGESHA
ncbi:MAG: hypothetical protein AAF127_17110 [Pseudomonadota bacterium]